MDCDADTTVVMDLTAIKDCIPHREPFLFVDRVLRLEENEIETEWELQPDAFFFRGHYPEQPILPGVLANEFVFQSSAILMAKLDGEKVDSQGVPVLTRISDAKFKRMVKPGEILRAVVKLNDRLGPACYMSATVTTGGKKVVRLEFVVALKATEQVQ